MTLTVENGSIVTGANSYISTTDFTAYATARGITLVTAAEQLLIRAMDYIESLQFIGTKVESDQPVQWPRTGVYIDGYAFPDDDIPQQLIDGQCQVAIAIDQGNDPMLDYAPAVKRKKVGPLEIEYTMGASVTINRKINNTLYKLLQNGGAGQIKVSKA